MRTFTVSSGSIAKCPTRNLTPKHYRTDGSCRHEGPKPVRGAGMAYVWPIPESELEIMWIGPGGGLFLGMPRQPGGAVTRIRHPEESADTYSSFEEADDAVWAFIHHGEDGHHG